MKRKFTLCFIPALAFALCACGGKAVSDTGNTEVMGTVEVVSAETEQNDIPAEGAEGSDDSGDSETEPFTMLFTGDVLFQNNIISAYDSKGLDGILSEELQQEMQDADLAMINEEFPFGVGGEKAPDKQYTFKADPSYVKIFNEMGVDIVSLANNHVLDFGKDVLSQTFTTLDEAGIPYVGAGETKERAMAWESFELNGTKTAVLCASRVIPVTDWDIRNSQPGVFTTYDPELLVEQIRKAKEENDLVVVYVHWGVEKAEKPEEYQRELAKAYIDAGADLVVGSHPHVLQGIEYYNGVPIVYSLGNFMFHETIDKTAVLKVVVDEEQNISLQLIPASASGSQTSELEGDSAQELYQYMESISFHVSIDSEGNVSAR